MKPIYKPKGAAGEYADLAINIYTGCTHGCIYCYAPACLRKDRDDFADARPRKGVVAATQRQLSSGDFAGKTIHLCFTCDPYPSGVNHSVTRGVIEAIKEAGAHVQILTKNPVDAALDFDLLDSDDMFGITLTGAIPEVEPGACREITRIEMLEKAHELGIGTWVSFEPVWDQVAVLGYIMELDFVDLIKIGKLNHMRSDIDWKAFGHEAERLCQELGRNYIIKKDLRAEMERSV